MGGILGLLTSFWLTSKQVDCSNNRHQTKVIKIMNYELEKLRCSYLYRTTDYTSDIDRRYIMSR